MGKLDALKNMFGSKKDIEDGLALKIVAEVKEVCKWYIDAEKKVKEVPEIAEGNGDEIKTFLKALASKLGRVDDINSEMENIETFVNGNHYKELFDPNNKEHMKSAQKLAGITNKDTIALSGIFQFYSKAVLFIGNIEKNLENIEDLYKKQKELDEKSKEKELALKNQIKFNFDEIKRVINGSNRNSEEWTKDGGLIDNLKEEIGTSKDKAAIIKKYMDEVACEAMNELSDTCGKISQDQISLRKKVDEYKNKILVKHVQLNVKKYFKNLKNIKNKLGKGSEYYEVLDKESKSVADEIYNYLDGKMKEYSWKPAKDDRVVIENGMKFIKWAGSILDELDISDEADKKIKKWYDDMKDACDVVRNAIEG